MTQIRKVSFQILSVMSFLILLFSNAATANTEEGKDAEKAQAIMSLIQEERNNFPEGSLDDFEYVKKILKFMSDTDEKTRTQFFSMQTQTQDTYEAMVDMDKFHLEKVKAIITKHGWVNISKFGKEADHHAAYLVQHADSDPVFQAGCAFVLEELVKKQETSPLNSAYLYDRVAMAFQMKQRYGTQTIFNPATKNFKLSPYEGTLGELDERRKKIGLPLSEDYLKLVNRVYVDKIELSEAVKDLNGKPTIQ